MWLVGRSVVMVSFCYEEEYANSDLYGLNTDLQSTNTAVEMGSATRVTWLEVVDT